MNEESLQIVQETFPGAMGADQLIRRVLSVIDEQWSVEAGRVLFADSICADDINSIQAPDAMADMLGPFRLGGLNGFPFTGPTGMGAYAHHVPDDGVMFVLYGPHIGVSRSGEVGVMLRPGQTGNSACCGAATAALGKLDQLQAGTTNELDFQQNAIEQMLLGEKDRIQKASNQMIAATEVVYDKTTERLRQIVSMTKFPCPRLVLVGGMVINGDHDMGMFFDVRRFVHIDTHSPERVEVDWSSYL